MNFGKVAFGTLLLVAGVLLLAIRLGLVPPDTPGFLLRFWPVLLIAFGLAFLAGALKNPFLGCLASILIVGGVAVGVFWMIQRHEGAKVSRGVASIDLGRAKVGSLTVRVRTFAGGFDLIGAPAKSRTLYVAVRNSAGDSASGYRFFASGKTGALEWPQRLDGLGLAPPGGGVDVQVPLHLELGDSGRPDQIHIGGALSTAHIRIAQDVPVQLLVRSPLTARTLPSDFVKETQGRGKGLVYAARGRGRVVKIFADGNLLHVKIERIPGKEILNGRR
ncbi:MAG: hypothetical protein E6K77_05965 [Candidatus Eisenbacteria bacterium]|uniref:LiaI-LiaF-like transmembrane region domain-containing protein n=1 Tax=Eiseniibacteriota bacterium TaxID=2212470 RepID=A0A538THF7_UNCEI|nr:MAG: hypothetical protein E6K77_05965 [Candidatus Eisenbacteria bacterium]